MKISTRQITLVAVFIAFCIIIPMLFHLIGAGKMFLPMLLPILLAGFIIDFPIAILVGLLGPYISALATGMPPLFPTALIMSVEGLVIILVVGICFQKMRLHVIICTIIGIVADRLTRILILYLILPLIGLPVRTLTIADLTYSLPGVIMLSIVVPVILTSLWKFKVVEKN